MRAKITAMGLNDDFAGQIIGMGNKIVIPDLSNDGAYGLSAFHAAGYKWVAAVPLMTYRCWGLLGTASKNKKLLDKDTAELIMVIGGLIANGLSKALVARHESRRPEPLRSRLPDILELQPDRAPTPVPVPVDTVTETTPVTSSADTTPQESLVNPPDVAPANPLQEEPAAVTATQKTPEEKSPPPAPVPPKPAPFTVVKKPVIEDNPAPNAQKPVDPAFRSHTRKMESFRKTHK
jgi:hypothetical protein